MGWIVREISPAKALLDRRWDSPKGWPPREQMEREFGHPAEWYEVMGTEPKTYITARISFSGLTSKEKRFAEEFVAHYLGSRGWHWKFKRSYE